MQSANKLALGAAIALLCALPGPRPAVAQTAQEIIDLDHEVAVEKRKTELAKLRRERDQGAGVVATRPLIAPEVKPAVEEQFTVRAIYGPTNSLRALVAYRDTLPVELSMRGGGEREIAGWKLSALDTRQLVLERRVPVVPKSAPSRKQQAAGQSEPQYNTERVVIPIRMQALATQAPPAVISPAGPQIGPSTMYTPTPLPAGVMPVIAPPAIQGPK